MQSMVVYSGSNTDCKSSEPLKTLVMLCYVMLCYVNNQFQNLPCMFGTVILLTMPLPFILANKFATTWFQTSKFIKLFCFYRHGLVHSGRADDQSDTPDT